MLDMSSQHPAMRPRRCICGAQVPPEAASISAGGWLPSVAVPAFTMALRLLAGSNMLCCRPEVDKVREQVLQRNPQVRLLLATATYDVLWIHTAPIHTLLGAYCKWLLAGTTANGHLNPVVSAAGI